MDPEAHKNVAAIAQLAAFTKAKASELDENIVSSSGNLKSSANWSPEDIVKRELQSMAESQPGGIAPPAAPAAPVPVLPAALPETQYEPAYAPPPPSSPQQMNNQLDLFTEINNRLKQIEEDVSKLENTYDKVMKAMLKNKAKTITIKFDEAQNSKQD
jgi:hypothetical protein